MFTLTHVAWILNLIFTIPSKFKMACMSCLINAESEVRDANSNAVPCVENKHLPNEKWKGGGAETLLKMENNASVSVKYHSNFGSHDDLLLLEVDDKLLSEFFNNRYWNVILAYIVIC